MSQRDVQCALLVRVTGDNPFFASRPQGIRLALELWEGKSGRDVGRQLQREFLYQNFAYGSLYGIRFTEQDGHGPEDCFVHGHGRDGCKEQVPILKRGNGRST